MNRGRAVTERQTVTMFETIERTRLEIATMLPHEVSIIRTMRQTAELGGRTITAESSERRTMRYECRKAKPE